MANIIKSIINELNKSPFNFNFNVVSFSGLQPWQLLQLLSDVLCEIEGKEKIESGGEPSEQLPLRLLTSLQILNYKPAIADLNGFQRGLAAGEPELIHPILDWLLSKRDDLKKRAYLARFLVKVDIPAEMRTDSDVAELYEQYEQLIEEFKQTHKLWDSGRNVHETVAELRKDLQTMEDDREVLTRRIERIQRKVEHVPNSTQLLAMAKKLRAEKEKNRELELQKEDQKVYLQHLDTRRIRLQQQLSEMRQSNSAINGQNVFQRLEDAIRANKYMLDEKLPKELENRTENMAVLEQIISSPVPQTTQLDELQTKVDFLNREIANLTEKRALEKDPTEDGMALYRQQALIVSRKKETCAQKLAEIRQEFHGLDAELKAKNLKLEALGTDMVLTGDKFKAYVVELRTKSNVYKQKRGELNDLKAEFGILSRTLELLKMEESSAVEALDQIEMRHGVRGFREAQEELEKISSEKADVDEEKSRTLEQMSSLVHVLNTKIGEKKNKLAPLLRELRPLRQKYQESLPDYETKKRMFQSEVDMIQNTLDTVTAAKSAVESELNQLEERRTRLERQIEEGHQHLLRAAEEMKLYVSGVLEKGRSVRDKFQARISEQEKLNVQLRQDQRDVRDNLPNLEKQIQYWDRIQKLFQVKMMCLEREKLQEGTVRREHGRETLVLQ